MILIRPGAHVRDPYEMLFWQETGFTWWTASALWSLGPQTFLQLVRSLTGAALTGLQPQSFFPLKLTQKETKNALNIILTFAYDKKSNYHIFYRWEFAVRTIILTVGNFLIKKKTSVHIHGKVHHVCVTEKVQFTIEQLLFIVDLKNIFFPIISNRTYKSLKTSTTCKKHRNCHVFVSATPHNPFVVIYVVTILKYKHKQKSYNS